MRPAIERPVLGFNGERPDPLNDTTHLGNGYRAYNPVLMRFSCPDSMSPFGKGGVNIYAYCSSDPVNQEDPTGHLSWQSWMNVGTGIVGLGLAIFSLGTSVPASVASLTLGVAGVVSDLAGVASALTEERHPKISAVLGWVSLATGVAGLADAIGSAGYSALNYSFSNKKSITLGLMDNFKNVRALGRTKNAAANIIEMGFIHEDNVKGLRRLNISAHGEPPTQLNPQGTLSIGGGRYNAQAIVGHIKNYYGMNFEYFHMARIVSCNSSSGGSASFAFDFSQLTRLPTEGFLGEVEVLVNNNLSRKIDAMTNGIFYKGMAPYDEVDLFNRVIERGRSLFKDELPEEIFPVRVDKNYNPYFYYPAGML